MAKEYRIFFSHIVQNSLADNAERHRILKPHTDLNHLTDIFCLQKTPQNANANLKKAAIKREPNKFFLKPNE